MSPMMTCPACRGSGKVELSQPYYRTYLFLVGQGVPLRAREIHEARDKVLDGELKIPGIFHRLQVLMRAGLVEKCERCRYRAIPPEGESTQRKTSS